MTNNWLLTDRPTNRPSDGPTDTSLYRGARTHLKIYSNETTEGSAIRIVPVRGDQFFGRLARLIRNIQGEVDLAPFVKFGETSSGGVHPGYADGARPPLLLTPTVS